jgi:hypothetical protein
MSVRIRLASDAGSGAIEPGARTRCIFWREDSNRVSSAKCLSLRLSLRPPLNSVLLISQTTDLSLVRTGGTGRSDPNAKGEGARIFPTVPSWPFHGATDRRPSRYRDAAEACVASIYAASDTFRHRAY